MNRPKINGTALLLSATFLGGCAAHATEVQRRAPIPIAIERVHAARAESIFSGPASVVAAHTYKLAFEVPGRIASVNVDVGDRVSAGTPLASIDDADYRAQMSAAAARAASAQAQARKTLAGSRPQEKAVAHDAVRAALAGLDQARAGFALAGSNAGRARALFEQGAISAQSRDGAIAAERDALARADSARAAAMAAQNQAALVELGARSEDRSAATAEANAAGATTQLAQITLNKTVLRAPRDAYVLQRSIEPGDEASPGVLAFTLTDAAPPDVLVSVPESKASQIAAGMPAFVIAGERRYAMRVIRLEPQADATTRTVQVRLHGDAMRLKPGAVVMAQIGQRRLAAASVPIGALLNASDGNTSIALYDAGSNSVRIRSIIVRSSTGDRVIVQGVRPGEFVVTGGQYQVRAGESVTVVSQGN